jgi:serine/threonine-protein kinase
VTGHLEHPNIVPVHAVGVDEHGQPVIVMKRVEGVSWRELLRDDDHPGWQRREPDRSARLVWHLQVLAQLCNAIAFAHSRGFVHRDMKPGNVLVGEFGEVYLIDWGVAVASGVASADRRVIGTPAYMAPEMVRGGPFDERTDVYLLGATLHEILTGEVRHPGGDLAAAQAHALASRPYPYGDEVPDELADLANRATAADPGARPPGALAFRQALLDHLRHRGSMWLSDDVDRTMAEVEAALDLGGSDPVDGAIQECRLGYRVALREWPENPGARRGLERCAVATVRLEIARRNGPAARAALDAMDDPPDDLRRAVTDLEAALSAERTERERLVHIAHDVDPTIGARARVAMVLILLLASTGASIVATHLHATGQLTPGRLIAFPAGVAVVTLLVVIAFWRRIRVNAFSRRMVAWFCVLIGSAVMMRAAGQGLGVSVTTQYVLDEVLITATIAVGAVFSFPWLWACAAFSATGGIVGFFWPDLVHIAFGASNLAAILLGALLLPKRRSA